MCTVYRTERVVRMLHLWRVQICMICMNIFFKLVPLLLCKRMLIHFYASSKFGTFTKE